ncbi:MAG: cysteine synthase family protein, partial [Mesorhizobium sp.]
GRALDYGCIDEGVQVTDIQAFETARYIARRKGLLVGGSTGGAIYKALEFIASGKLTGTIVTTVVDGGEKYLGTIFDDDWMAKRRLLDPSIAAQLDGWLTTREHAVGCVLD